MTLYSPGGLNLADTTAPLILAYDDTGTTDVVFAVSATGDLTITPDGGDVTVAAKLTITGVILATNAAGDPANCNYAFTGDPNTGMFYDGADQLSFATAGVRRIHVTAAGLVAINDLSNAKMTIGLTINQGGADDEILALKSSDVAHGMTAIVETDTYGKMQKASALEGGLLIAGYSDAAAGRGLYFQGTVGGAADTDKTTSAVGVVQILAGIKNGTGDAVVGADGNLCVISNQTTARFIFDAEGSAHADVEWIAFDEHDDLQVIEDMETLLAPGRVSRMFGEVVSHDRAFFEDEGLLHDVRGVGGGRTHGMLNTTRGLMLAFGGIRQVGGRLMAVESREERLELCVRHLVDVNPILEGRTEALALLEAA